MSKEVKPNIFYANYYDEMGLFCITTDFLKGKIHFIHGNGVSSNFICRSETFELTGVFRTEEQIKEAVINFCIINNIENFIISDEEEENWREIHKSALPSL